MSDTYVAHPTAVLDPPVSIGAGTRIWHFSHVMSGAAIGCNCVLGQNTFIAATVRIGDRVRIQNNVSLYDGVQLEDDVFCGPSAVFTNVINPRAQVERKREFQSTLVRQGATIGANATIICGTTLGRYVFVAAGAVVTRGNYPDYALLTGVPARRRGWMSKRGLRLAVGADGLYRCPESEETYREVEPSKLICLDDPR